MVWWTGRCFVKNWWTWWLGDVAGLMIVVPLILACHQRGWRTWNVGRRLELAVLFLCVVAAGQCIFGNWLSDRLAENMIYATMILLIWVALRFELAEITAATLLLCLAAIWGISRGVGAYRTEDSLFHLQIFMNVYAATGLAMAGIIAERREAACGSADIAGPAARRDRSAGTHPRSLPPAPGVGTRCHDCHAGRRRDPAGQRSRGEDVWLPSRRHWSAKPSRCSFRSVTGSGISNTAEYKSAPHIRLMGIGVELSARRRDGRAFPVEIALGPLPTDEGLFVISSIRDVTDRKLAEKALRDSQERFDLAVRGTDAGIWDWDLRTNQVFFSPRWKGMLGYEDHEIQASFAEWRARLHPDDRQRALATIREYLDGQRTEYELEHRLQHKDGTYRWILARGAGRPG